MATVADLLAIKGACVHGIGPDATALDAALRMNEHGIGALVVVDDGQVLGIFTERDVMRRVVAERRDPAETRVAHAMTTHVHCCDLDWSVDEAAEAMRERRVRHLPVLAPDGRLVGLISIGDLNAHRVDSQERTIHHLHEYLHGRA